VRSLTDLLPSLQLGAAGFKSSSIVGALLQRPVDQAKPLIDLCERVRPGAEQRQASALQRPIRVVAVDNADPHIGRASFTITVAVLNLQDPVEDGSAIDLERPRGPQEGQQPIGAYTHIAGELAHSRPRAPFLQAAKSVGDDFDLPASCRVAFQRVGHLPDPPVSPGTDERSVLLSGQVQVVGLGGQRELDAGAARRERCRQTRPDQSSSP
jgi:hypothetical protein